MHRLVDDWFSWPTNEKLEDHENSSPLIHESPERSEMSGTIFVDLSESNPLTCRLCAQELVEPMTLPCQHSFCAHCIGAAKECGLCAAPFDAARLAVDPVLTYVLESSKEATESCANCDQIAPPMNFCETCQQPLCAQCVVLTHSARFFASHQISPLDERGRQRGQPTCAEHNGPFVLFCQETKKLMCIECFNASSLDKRHSFVNLDVAHKQCREKLDESVVRLRAFQDELVEQNDARRRLLVDLETKYAAAEEKLLSRFNALVAALTDTKSELLAEIREIRADRKAQVERQLKALENVEGPIRTNLLCASVFCSYASHFDLLHCYAELHRSINAIIGRKTEKVPFSSNLELDWDERINDVLKRDLEAHSSTSTSGGILPFRFVAADLNPADSRGSSEPLNGGGALMHLGSRSTIGGLSHLLAAAGGFGGEGASGVFVEHFQKMDAPLRQFAEQSALLSKSLLGLQRDITFNQRVVDKQTVEALIRSCEELEQRLDGHSALVNESRTAMVAAWNEQMEAMQKQQLLVNNAAHELASLQRFTRNVAETSRKLQPLTSFLSAVIQTIRPAAVEITPPMEQICSQIVSICPDSKQRVEAIEKEEEQRRVAREREKRACEEEARGLKKGLRETRRPRPRPLSSALLVENSRDRNDAMGDATSRRKQQRLKRSSQSDESTADPRSSSRVFSSTTSLDASSGRTDGHSPASASPGPLFEDADELEASVERLSLATPARPPSAATSESLDERAIVKSPPQTPPPPPKRPPSIHVDAAPSAETIQARHALMQSIKDRVKRID